MKRDYYCPHFHIRTCHLRMTKSLIATSRTAESEFDPMVWNFGPTIINLFCIKGYMLDRVLRSNCLHRKLLYKKEKKGRKESHKETDIQRDREQKERKPLLHPSNRELCQPNQVHKAFQEVYRGFITCAIVNLSHLIGKREATKAINLQDIKIPGLHRLVKLWMLKVCGY